MKWTVLIVDDDEEFRGLARALLDGGALHVLGEAAGGEEAITRAAALRPAVVLIDVGLPDGDGFALAERSGRRTPAAPAVVMVSSRDERTYRSASVPQSRSAAS